MTAATICRKDSPDSCLRSPDDHVDIEANIASDGFSCNGIFPFAVAEPETAAHVLRKCIGDIRLDTEIPAEFCFDKFGALSHTHKADRIGRFYGEAEVNGIIDLKIPVKRYGDVKAATTLVIDRRTELIPLFF